MIRPATADAATRRDRSVHPLAHDVGPRCKPDQRNERERDAELSTTWDTASAIVGSARRPVWRLRVSRYLIDPSPRLDVGGRAAWLVGCRSCVAVYARRMSGMPTRLGSSQ